MTKNSNPSRLILLAVLALAALLIVLERCHTYAEPLERDITTYAVIGQELLRGRALYTDLWDHKPPAIHVTFALAEALVGEGPFSIFLLNVLSALAVLAALYQGGKAVGGVKAGLGAALIWAVVSGDPGLQANQPNEEVFLNAFQAWVFALWLTARADGSPGRRWILIGILSAIASLYKPFAVLEVLLLSVVTLSLSWASFRLRKRALQQAAIVLACVLAAWAGVLAWFSFQGRWGDFRDAVFTYNFSYSGYQGGSFSDFLKNIGGQALDFATLAWLFLLFALGCLGVFFGRRKKEGQGPWLLWAAFLVAAELEVLAPGRFFAHYDQLLLPPLIVGAVWGVTLLNDWIGRKGWEGLPTLILLVVLIFHEAPFYKLSPEAWANKKYADGPLFAESYQLGRELNIWLAPGESFYEWGNESELYFAARRSPPSGVFYSYPLLNNPLAGDLAARVVADLQKTKPELVVLNTNYYVSEDLFQRHPVLRWIRENYQPVLESPNRKAFRFLMRKGGNLEKRLQGASGISLPSKSRP